MEGARDHLEALRRRAPERQDVHARCDDVHQLLSVLESMPMWKRRHRDRLLSQAARDILEIERMIA